MDYEEEWKDIYFVENGVEYDYRGLYQINGLGKIKSLGNNKNRKEKILKVTKNKKGYLHTILCKNGKQKNFDIHRLVGHMFVEGYFDGACIDHINTITDDNRVENLRWVTHKENCNNPLTLKNHSEAIKGENHPLYGKHHTEETKNKMSDAKKGDKCWAYGKHFSEEHRKKLGETSHGSPKQVAQYDKDMNLIKIWKSGNEAEKELGISRGGINKCCKFWEMNCNKEKWFKTHKTHPVKTAGGFIWKYIEEE